MGIEEIFKKKICQANCEYRDQCNKDCIETLEQSFIDDPELTLTARCLKYKPIKYIRRRRYEKKMD